MAADLAAAEEVGIAVAVAVAAGAVEAPAAEFVEPEVAAPAV